MPYSGANQISVDGTGLASFVVVAGFALAALVGASETPRSVSSDAGCADIEQSVRKKLDAVISTRTSVEWPTMRAIGNAAESARHHCRNGRTEQARIVYENLERRIAALNSLPSGHQQARLSAPQVP